ncbi:TPA: hypothetical protein MB352_004687 [Klebsiella variicola subsp. variicola]|nr:hypothetical protein [Klebsiella variicola subsp. variicola]
MAQITDLVQSVTNLEELIEIVVRLYKPRDTATFVVEKDNGVSIQRSRRAENNAVYALLKSLFADFGYTNLSDEHRQILAGCTGEGEITD